MAKGNGTGLDLQAIKEKLNEVRQPIVDRLKEVKNNLFALAEEEMELTRMLERLDGPQSQAPAAIKSGRGRKPKAAAAVAAPKGGKRGKRGRITPEEKAKASDSILAMAEKAKEAGVSRGEAAEHAKVKPPQAAAILKELVKGKKLKVQGTKASARYYVA